MPCGVGVTVVVEGVVGAVTADTVSPEALRLTGITEKPCGTALLNTTAVFGSYVVNEVSGEATSMNLESGVVLSIVPTPLLIATGPNGVITPLSSTV